MTLYKPPIAGKLLNRNLETEVGSVGVNKHCDTGPGVPFGYVAQSGSYLEFAKEGLGELSQMQAISEAR